MEYMLMPLSRYATFTGRARLLFLSRCAKALVFMASFGAFATCLAAGSVRPPSESLSAHGDSSPSNASSGEEVLYHYDGPFQANGGQRVPVIPSQSFGDYDKAHLSFWVHNTDSGTRPMYLECLVGGSWVNAAGIITLSSSNYDLPTSLLRIEMDIYPYLYSSGAKHRCGMLFTQLFGGAPDNEATSAGGLEGKEIGKTFSSQPTAWRFTHDPTGDIERLQIKLTTQR